MKINISVDESATDLTVSITCKHLTPDIERIIAALRMMNHQLDECGFFRVSKSFLIHLQKIQSLRTDINRKIRITMSNGEQIMASRQYAEKLKKRLGVI